MSSGEARGATLQLVDLGLLSRDLSHLELPCTKEEVEKVVNSLPPDKSPGPDGFTNRFFASC